MTTSAKKVKSKDDLVTETQDDQDQSVIKVILEPEQCFTPSQLLTSLSPEEDSFPEVVGDNSSLVITLLPPTPQQNSLLGDSDENSNVKSSSRNKTSEKETQNEGKYESKTESRKQRQEDIKTERL